MNPIIVVRYNDTEKYIRRHIIDLTWLLLYIAILDEFRARSEEFTNPWDLADYLRTITYTPGKEVEGTLKDIMQSSNVMAAYSQSAARAHNPLSLEVYILIVKDYISCISCGCYEDLNEPFYV